jgi:hypothetical protein
MLMNTPEVSEDRPSWSPDGAEVAYQAQVHTDAVPNWDIYTIAVPSGNKIIIPTPTQSPEPTPAPTPTAAPTPAPLTQEQFATSATASSEYTIHYGAMMATGAPETRPACGDAAAWSPLRGGNDSEWLEAWFALPVFATGLTVYEPYNSGFVYQVDLIDTEGAYHTIWTGTDNTGCPGEFVLTFARTSYKVQDVKIYTQIADYEEIEAIKLLGAVD